MPSPPDRLSRDASGRLCLDLNRDYPRFDTDANAVVRDLVSIFHAQPREHWDDFLGDASMLRLIIAGRDYTLDHDHWSGLMLIAHAADGEPLLLRIADHFHSHSPPITPAPDQ